MLAAAELADRFPVVVDGGVAAASAACAGKPSPETFLHAAAALGVPAGTRRRDRGRDRPVSRPGSAGGFGLVIGVDRGAGAEALREAARTSWCVTSLSW